MRLRRRYALRSTFSVHDMHMHGVNSVVVPVFVARRSCTCLCHECDERPVEGSHRCLQAFGELGFSSESRALIGLYNGRTHCKKNHYGKPEKPVQLVFALLHLSVLAMQIVLCFTQHYTEC